MKLMQWVAAVTVASALTLGAAGCAKKEEAAPEAGAGAAKKGFASGIADKLKEEGVTTETETK